MSDLAATNCGCDNGCGCGCDNGCGTSLFGGNGSCSCIIWILVLLSCCGGDGFGRSGCGSDNSCMLIIILLLCCGGFGGSC